MYQGQVNGSATVLPTTSLPVAGAESLTTTEYSSVEVSPEGKKQALMRRCLRVHHRRQVQLLPEQRVEELTLQWVGNTQINPTLLGYIEGAAAGSLGEPHGSTRTTTGPPAITLRQSDETSYSLQRSETFARGSSMDGFLGGGVGRRPGPAFIDRASSRRARHGAALQL